MENIKKHWWSFCSAVGFPALGSLLCTFGGVPVIGAILFLYTVVAAMRFGYLVAEEDNDL